MINKEKSPDIELLQIIISNTVSINGTAPINYSKNNSSNK